MAVATPNQNMSAAQQAAMLAAQQREQNRRFMALSLNKEALCQQANGGANSQTFAPGQPLTYNIPTAQNGYLTGFWVRCTLNITLNTGTAATYAANAAFPLNLIDSVVVNYGGNQHNFRPYIMSYLNQFRGALQQRQPRTVLGGQVNTYYQGYLNTITPATPAAGINQWTFAFFVPLNIIHPQDVRGILPIQNGETTCQIVVNCANAVVGPDPVLNAVAITGGTGGGLGSVNAGSTVQVIAQYKDGSSYSQLQALQPNMSGIETVQIQRDTPLNNLTTGQVMRGKIGFLHKIPWLIITVIDGNQSNKFASTSNIQIIETTADQTGNKPFIRYGLNTNLDVREFFTDINQLLEQDFDEGIFPLVTGPIFQQADASILEGQHYLDMTTASGHTDFHYGVQLGTIGGVAGISPRIEAHVVLLNDPLTM